MLPKGGSEIIKDQLVSLLPEGSLDGINLITSICYPLHCLMHLHNY